MAIEEGAKLLCFDGIWGKHQELHFSMNIIQTITNTLLAPNCVLFPWICFNINTFYKKLKKQVIKLNPLL